MTNALPTRVIRQLQVVAYLVIILWAIRSAAEILVPVLLGLLLAYCFLPLPKWFMERFALGKRSAIALASASVGALIVISVPLLYWRFTQLREKLPIYQEHFISRYQSVAEFLQGHGIKIPAVDTDAARAFISDHISEYLRLLVPHAARILGDGLLIAILASYFLSTMAEHTTSKRGAFAEGLNYYGGDVQRYVAITARSGAIAALANLVLLTAFGVDFALLWSVFGFFMSFIPNVGFIATLIPPTILALFMSGWTTALLVGGGLILINLVQEYGLNPIFMKKGVDVSFIEIILSLMFWSFLLGPAGAVLAIPLTLALRRFIKTFANQESPA
jgi:AI-2 transport protein TqsA